MSILFVGLLLVAGAWFFGQHARTLFHLGDGEPAARGQRARRTAAPATGARSRPSPNRPSPKPAKTEPAEAAPAADTTAAEPAGARRHASDAPAPAASEKKRRGGERPMDFVGRDIAKLKDQMAPDPSQAARRRPPATPRRPAPAPTPAPSEAP